MEVYLKTTKNVKYESETEDGGVSLCSPDCPESCFVDQGVLESRPACLFLPSAGVKGKHHHLTESDFKTFQSSKNDCICHE